MCCLKLLSDRITATPCLADLETYVLKSDPSYAYGVVENQKMG